MPFCHCCPTSPLCHCCPAAYGAIVGRAGVLGLATGAALDMDRSSVSGAERGQTITAVCYMSATGVFVPPALILPRKRTNPLLYKDAPNATLPLISDTGYMNSHLFIDWLKHFFKHAKPSTEDPVPLIADNHTSHCSLSAVLFNII
ncbi:hypothetical protein AVEN_121358-1 [Araneus ventricosus]|uniref:DDE-1 domain-containing protein n=1 Tax=Araneus ventricosus TaxID=182803 RepID=A0A4Y2VYI3_ARAVE|nr:hypothetical protein AVEN_121358-1 [Araneus ventricosus]